MLYQDLLDRTVCLYDIETHKKQFYILIGLKLVICICKMFEVIGLNNLNGMFNMPVLIVRIKARNLLHLTISH